MPVSPSPLLGMDKLSNVHASVFMNMEHSLSLPLIEQNINNRVWDDGKSVSRAQNTIPIAVKIKDKDFNAEIIPRFRLPHSLQSDNGSTFKAAVTQGVSKALGTEHHLHCSWRPQSSGKAEKANDKIKRQLHILSQETQDNWIKVLPITLMRIRTAPKRRDCLFLSVFVEGLSFFFFFWKAFLMHRHCYIP